MSPLWVTDGDDWQTLDTTPFPSEGALHDRVEEAPHLLPLSGDPQVIILGREVQLGPGRADLLAVEPNGRPVLIEVKLKGSNEAKRAIIGQVLSYAAFLRGLSVEDLESTILAPHLAKREYESIRHAVVSNYQAGQLDEAAFDQALADCLSKGRFRLVLVLDDAPPELVRVVGYLEAISGDVAIDLITVSSYEIGGQQVLVPERIEPDASSWVAPSGVSAPTKSYSVAGWQDFADSIADAPAENRPDLTRLLEWAKGLASKGYVKLSTSHGSGRLTLVPALKGHGAGLVTIWNDDGKAYISVWRSVFERLAPISLLKIQDAISPQTVGQGTTVTDFSEATLRLFEEAHAEATAPADTVIVAASEAYREYKQLSAYICQTDRSFRGEITRLGFYADREIKPELPRILARRRDVLIVVEPANDLLASADAIDRKLGRLIADLVKEGSDRIGQKQQVFLLSAPGDPETLTLLHAIKNDGHSAWVQAHRYVKAHVLQSGISVTSEITGLTA